MFMYILKKSIINDFIYLLGKGVVRNLIRFVQADEHLQSLFHVERTVLKTPETA